jgi:FG-GAP repeat
LRYRVRRTGVGCRRGPRTRRAEIAIEDGFRGDRARWRFRVCPWAQVQAASGWNSSWRTSRPERISVEEFLRMAIVVFRVEPLRADSTGPHCDSSFWCSFTHKNRPLRGPRSTGFRNTDSISPIERRQQHGASTSPVIIGTVKAVAQNGFQAPISCGAGTSPSAVAVGDFNGDGRVDLAGANYRSQRLIGFCVIRAPKLLRRRRGPLGFLRILRQCNQ